MLLPIEPLTTKVAGVLALLIKFSIQEFPDHKDFFIIIVNTLIKPVRQILR